MSNAPKEARVICTYGPSGVGKTVDMGYSFPRALFVAAPGALNSIRSVCGYQPDRIEVKTIAEGTKLLLEVAKKKTYEEVVFDDFSFLAQQTFSLLEKKMTGFKLWGELRDQALEFREAARFSTLIVALNCWEQPPKTKDGVRMRGGPMLSGNLPEQIPALCDVVLRAMSEPMRKPWSAVYRCTLEAAYVMKDRYDIATAIDPAPMNLAELLRARDVAVARHPAASTQEEDVASLATRFTGDGVRDMAEANKAYQELLARNQPPVLARWTVRDAMDRATIYRSLALRANNFFV